MRYLQQRVGSKFVSRCIGPACPSAQVTPYSERLALCIVAAHECYARYTPEFEHADRFGIVGRALDADVDRR